MRNIVDWMRDVLFQDLSAKVDTYENTFNARPELEDASTPLASDHSLVDETQSIGFGIQPNATLNSQEVLETDNESVYESIESAHVDRLTTQGSSLSNANNEEKEIMIDSAAPSRSSRTPGGVSRSLHTLVAV